MFKLVLQLLDAWEKSIAKFYWVGYQDGIKRVVADLQKAGVIECVGVSYYDNQDTGETHVDYELRVAGR